MKVYKYPVAFAVRFTEKLPKGATVLSVNVQNYVPFMWVSFDENNEEDLEERSFALVTTGSVFDLSKKSRYIGTFLAHGGDFVAHLFEENKE